MSEAVSVADWQWCEQCGYWLRGLPTTGACPECGTAYDENKLALFGWGAFGLMTVRLHRKGCGGCTIAVCIYFGLAGLGLLLAKSWGQGVYILSIAVAAGAMYEWARVKAAKIDKPTAYVTLGAEGYRFRSGWGPAAVWQWKGTMAAAVTPCGPTWYRLDIVRRYDKGRKDPYGAVRFVFPCDAARAKEIQKQLDGWRAAAK